MKITLLDLANKLGVSILSFSKYNDKLSLPWYKNESDILYAYKHKQLPLRHAIMAQSANACIVKKDYATLKECFDQWATVCKWKKRTFEEQEFLSSIALEALPTLKHYGK